MKQIGLNEDYSIDTIGSALSTKLPTCKPTDSFEHILQTLTTSPWDDIDYIFVLNDQSELLGTIDMATLVQHDKTTLAKDLMTKSTLALNPKDKRSMAIFYAVKHDADIIPVVDDSKKFIGAIISKTIIDLMHEEHIEDNLLVSGIHGKRYHKSRMIASGIFGVIQARLPWLFFGLLTGLGLGIISSWFEESLRTNVAIAYFIPVIAYMGGSVSTQSEAITVRTLATTKINYFIYLMRELLIGTIIGVFIGIVGGLGALLISGQNKIGFIVGLALFFATAFAAFLASSIAIFFKSMGKDPALGSGPMATALQDIISVLIYFLLVGLFL